MLNDFKDFKRLGMAPNDPEIPQTPKLFKKTPIYCADFKDLQRDPEVLNI